VENDEVHKPDGVVYVERDIAIQLELEIFKHWQPVHLVRTYL
jgi:hypothetical protein